MSHEIVAALIVRSQKILLGHRSATRTFYPDVWDVFGGHMEPGEQGQETLLRELAEELGITPTQWMVLETLNKPSEQLTVHLYLVRTWRGTPVNRQHEEHTEIGWFSLAETTQLRLADSSYPMLFERYLASNPKPYSG